MSGVPKERLLLYGGSFDPPHWGHMNLLKNALAAVQPSRVLVVPSGTSPHKHASETPWKLRAEMCECFRPLFPELVVSDMEERRPGKSYTYDTVEELKAAHPEAELYLCVGGDMLESFTTWHRWQELLQKVVLVALPRLDDEMAALQAVAQALREQGGRVVFARGSVVEVSSTEIRAAVARGQKDALCMVPPPADEVVRANGLYRHIQSPEQ